MLYKIAEWFLDNLITIAIASLLSYAGYSLYKDIQRTNVKEQAMQEKYGDEYGKSWHAKDDREPTKLTHVKGLEDCVYVIMELGRNDTRHVIRCKGDAQVTVPGKFPKTTALVN